MNFGLSREIYGLNPWCVDAHSLPYLTSILKNLQNGISLEIPETKYNSPFVYDCSNQTELIYDTWQLNNTKQFEGVGVINIDGVITKNGGASSLGMNQLSEVMLSMVKDERIKGFILKTDSGGGASGAVEVMRDTINLVKQTKPVYAFVPKGGMMASAAYGIGSTANAIYSASEMNVFGSVGTMIQFEGKPANSVSKDGTKNIVLYATKSTKKNEAFNEALNNDNYELLINELLDPINESFINMVQENRPQLKGTKFDDGHTVFAKNGIGTFIDGIASFDEVVNMILNDSKKIKINSKSSTMTKQDLKQNHPELFNEVLNEGVAQELDRVNSWMVFASADLETVKNGIKSGENLKQSEIVELSVKMNSAQMLANLNQDSAKPVTTAQTPVAIDKKEENEELDNAFKFEL